MKVIFITYVILVLFAPFILTQIRLWRCDNGQQIDRSKTCDGKFDCADRSDETSSECQSIVFEPEQFTQNVQLTRRNETNPHVDQMVTTTSKSPPNPEQLGSGSCRIATIPENSYIYLSGEPLKHLQINDIVENFATIQFTCIENQLVVGDYVNLCNEGKWLREFPTCEVFCNPNKLSSITFQPTCKFNRRNVKCSAAAKPRTTVRVSCKEGYEDLRAEDQTITCGSDGRWYPEPSACSQICGEIESEGTPYIVGGFATNISQAPWNALIYKEFDSKFEHQCTGTILNARIIISAMHCFWDPVLDGPSNASSYRVKVGKTFRDYDDIRDTTKVQSFSVRNITRFEAYKGIENAFVGDIAILLLDDYIEFKPYISPICINYDLKYKDFVPEGQRGMVAGWGLEQPNGNASPSLKILELPVAQQQECKNATGLTTSDKFCAGHLNLNVGVCQGDSGAALVLREDKNGRAKYFIRGLVSANTAKGGSCDPDSYSKFTNTAVYSDFIKRHEFQYRPRASSIGCPTLTTTRNGHITYYGSDGFILNNKNDSEYYDSGTKVEINCLTGYEISGASQQNLTCDESGIWTPLLQDSTCIPICGREAPTGSAYIVGGNETDINKVPWHVGIYKIEGPNINYKCGGSILTETIVISAMHCFWDRSIEKAFDPSLFKVAAGKQFVNYNSTQEPYLVQYFDVADLNYYDYRDLHGNFASDIVLVVLSSRIEFRQHIAPICLQLDQVTILDVPVKDGLVGTLAGWGLTESHGQPSQRLKIVDLPTVNKDKCIKDSGYGFQDFVTLDKFCAGHLNLEISACQGDSGGGLVFSQVFHGRKRFFLRGIVSVGANNLDSCDSSKYTAFTNVVFHDNFVRSVLFPK